MTDRDAFMTAIIADRDNDAPHLIFADWLEEHGDGPRAEFIRLQCRLPDLEKQAGTQDKSQRHQKLKCCGSDSIILGRATCPVCRERWHLYQREDQLLRQHGTEWFAQFCAPWATSSREIIHHRSYYSMRGLNGLNGLWQECQFRRGFIGTVSCWGNDWVSLADAMLKAAPLCEVTLDDWPTMNIKDTRPLVGPIVVNIAGMANTYEITPGMMERETWAQMRPKVVGHLLREQWPHIAFVLPLHNTSSTTEDANLRTALGVGGDEQQETKPIGLPAFLRTPTAHDGGDAPDG